MLAKLMGQNGGVEPVEGNVAPIDQFHEGIQNTRLLPGLVTKAEMMPAFYEAEGFHRIGFG